MMASILLAPIKNTIRRDFNSSKSNTIMLSDLHSVDKNCGIDSDAGISISTLREDFIWIDESEEKTMAKVLEQEIQDRFKPFDMQTFDVDAKVFWLKVQR